ncbi:DUF3500 domain-containing protein [Agromyces sp. SYSU T00266]|uniref:DUF3500 domain-containing protein n=1 Tax=Agromyces zhanjiangensis TaxID=3158562 RepID=UPI0033910D70
MPSRFREFVFPKHPLLGDLGGLDPYEYADVMRGVPVLGDVITQWLELFESTSFQGVTADGAVLENLFAVGADEGAPTLAAVDAATALLDSLSDEEREKIQHPLDSKVWRAWMNPEFLILPYGARLEELTPESLERSMELIASSTSPRGYEKIVNLMRINAFLGEILEVPVVINEHSYNLNIFGTPSMTEPWGWNLWGHHVCLNTLFLGAQQVFTPVFFGAEPNEIDEGAFAGTTEFLELDRAGLDLIQSLDDAQRAKAILFDDKRSPDLPPGRLVPGDELHLAGCFQDNRLIPYEGISATELTGEQQELLWKIVDEFLSYQPDGPRAARVADARKHLESTWFCWIGGTGDDDVFYYRVQSPVILIEFDHHGGLALANQNPERFHVHTIVRTPNGNDYGVQLVRQATGSEQTLTAEA